jgi:hypothetical protein
MSSGRMMIWLSTDRAAAARMPDGTGVALRLAALRLAATVAGPARPVPAAPVAAVALLAVALAARRGHAVARPILAAPQLTGASAATRLPGVGRPVVAGALQAEVRVVRRVPAPAPPGVVPATALASPGKQAPGVDTELAQRRLPAGAVRVALPAGSPSARSVPSDSRTAEARTNPAPGPARAGMTVPAPETVMASAPVAPRGAGRVSPASEPDSSVIASAPRADVPTTRGTPGPTAEGALRGVTRRRLEPGGRDPRRMPAQRDRTARMTAAHPRTGGSRGPRPPLAGMTADHPVRIAARATGTTARTGRTVRPGSQRTTIGEAAGRRRAPVTGGRMRQRVSRAARVPGIPTARPATVPTAVVVSPRVVVRRVLVAVVPPKVVVRPVLVIGSTPPVRAERKGPAAAEATATKRTTNRPGAHVPPGAPRLPSHRVLIPSCWTPPSDQSSGR